MEEDTDILQNPSWSADGRLLAIELEDDHDNELYLCEPAREASRRVLTSAELGSASGSGWEYQCPTFARISPDGCFVAFCKRVGKGETLDEAPVNLYLADVRSPATRIKKLTRFTDDWALEPTWSPDSTRIAFVVMSERHSLQIIGLNGKAIDVFNLGLYVESPSWSPDGRYLVFAAQSETKPELYGGFWSRSHRRLHLLDLASRRVQVLETPDNDPYMPRWLRTGRHVVYLCNPELPGEAARILELAEGNP